MGIICSYFLLGIAIVTDNLLFPNLPKNLRTDVVEEIIDIVIIILIAIIILIFIRIIIANFNTQLIIIAQKYSVKLLASIAGISILGELFLFIIASLVKDPSEKIISPMLAFAFSSLLVPCLKYLQNMPILKVEVFNRLNDIITWDDYVNVTACWHGKNAKRVSFLGFCTPGDLGTIQEHGEGFKEKIKIPKHLKNCVHSLNEVIEPNQYGLKYRLNLSDIKCDHKEDSLIALYTDTDLNIFFKEFKIDNKMESNQINNEENSRINFISKWLYVCALVLMICYIINIGKLKQTNFYTTYLLFFIAIIVGNYAYSIKEYGFNKEIFYVVINEIIGISLSESLNNVLTESPDKDPNYYLNYLGMIIVIINICWILMYLNYTLLCSYISEFFRYLFKDFYWSECILEKMISRNLKSSKTKKAMKEYITKQSKKING